MSIGKNKRTFAAFALFKTKFFGFLCELQTRNGIYLPIYCLHERSSISVDQILIVAV